MDKLQRLGTRLDKLGIKIQLAGNYPWVYLISVNGNTIEEKLMSSHRYTIYFESSNSFANLKDMFKIIRKYK